MRIFILGLALALSACSVERPTHIAPVSAFNAERYLGTWHEIARIDNRFEKGLSRVSAEYKANPDGGITVINRGYEAASGQWKDGYWTVEFRRDRVTPVKHIYDTMFNRLVQFSVHVFDQVEQLDQSSESQRLFLQFLPPKQELANKP